MLTLEAQNVVHEYNTLDPASQDDVKAEIAPSGFPIGEKHRFQLWRSLLFGVIAIAICGLAAGTILAFQGFDATAVLVLATAATTGVLGLFAKSPTQ
jgi:hypothetical protein